MKFPVTTWECGLKRSKKVAEAGSARDAAEIALVMARLYAPQYVFVECKDKLGTSNLACTNADFTDAQKTGFVAEVERELAARRRRLAKYDREIEALEAPKP